MENHILCYVQRNRITDWKRLVITDEEPAFLYGSNDERVFVKHLVDGGTLWVVSSIPTRPPELVACLSVTTVAKRDDPKLEALGVSKRLLRHFAEFNWIAVGGYDSEFFGHNVAGSALLQTTFESTSGEPWVLSRGSREWRGEYGMKLQRPTKVSNKGLDSQENGIAALRALAATSAQSVFVSWKWCDNSKRLVRSLAYALAESGFMPWVDLLALPRSKALLKVQEDEEKLESLLRYGYRRCFGVIGVETVNYGTQSEGSDENWTLREWEGAFAQDRAALARIAYRPKGATSCGVMSCPDLRLSGTDPRMAARELRNWLDSRPETH
jgi:hypothetical protein